MPYKPHIAKDGTLVFRQETFKVVCSEDDAKAIVGAIVDFTAYMLSVSRTTEMPSPQSLRNSLVQCKTRLATLLATARKSPVNPDHLTLPKAEVMTVGGYFDILFFETVPRRTDSPPMRRSYKLRLQDATGMVIFEKVLFILRHSRPELSPEERILEANRWLGVF